jgi:DNA-binding IclR family transcriptional regulator
MAPPIGKKQTKLNALMFAMLLEELLSGPCTAQALAEHTGMALITTQRTLRTMYRRGALHIGGWERDAAGRYTVRVFALGHGRDAKKPIKTRLQMNREYRARKSMSPLMSFAA